MNEENLEALIPCAGDGAWNLLPGEDPQVLLVGTRCGNQCLGDFFQAS